MLIKKYCFASINFHISSYIPVEDGRYFSSFVCDCDCKPDYKIIVREHDLPSKKGKCIFDYKNASGYESDGRKFVYSSYQQIDKTDYACLERNGTELDLTIKPGIKLRDNVLFMAINIPGLMLENDVAIIHSSFIIINGEAILFTGKSGIGKSTQAELWNKVFGADIINGDRAAIKEENGVLYAYGIPFCGSSKVAVNKKAPVKAIVSLSKGTKNDIRKLSNTESFAVVLSGMTYEPKNSDECSMAVQFAVQVAESVPVFSFQCTKDETAVYTLQKKLKVKIHE